MNPGYLTNKPETFPIGDSQSKTINEALREANFAYDTTSCTRRLEGVVTQCTTNSCEMQTFPVDDSEDPQIYSFYIDLEREIFHLSKLQENPRDIYEQINLRVLDQLEDDDISQILLIINEVRQANELVDKVEHRREQKEIITALSQSIKLGIQELVSKHL